MSNDELYQQLVKALALYDSLLEQLQSSFQDGFHLMSRANYHNKQSLRGSYGQDYWDETYTGSRFVKIYNDHSIKEVKESKYDIDSEDINDSNKYGEKLAGEKETLRKRKQREKLLEKVKEDPIYMFGGALSVPLALKLSLIHI